MYNLFIHFYSVYYTINHTDVPLKTLLMHFYHEQFTKSCMHRKDTKIALFICCLLYTSDAADE